jgi:hypothetical protein
MQPDISGIGLADLVEIMGDTSWGDDESGAAFVGDDYSSIIGAVQQATSKALSSALATKRAQSGSLLRSMPPRSSREFALGLGSTNVAGSSSANINVQPQVIFRPERLVIPSNVAPDFLITDIKVGKNSQLVSTGALPAVGFTETAFGVRLKMDTCQISMFVTLTVTNQNVVAKNFQGMIIGPAVE